ncbi:DUF4349 domain-containing protein [Oscillibacter sp.]|uniref:DUF4349 domain-containing protein n=1 Tax=Oscillibacter sp. TaxID=1945593 RepID=UPI0026066323|nr:DUF4349 domain-containing protein [Oscillibacter sp.]MBS6355188.1 DUF4349 domain-containing protein [Oscillibacter sp.]
MKRGFAWLLTLLALLGLLSGCGGGDTAAADTATSADTADNGTAASGGSYGAWAETEVAEDSGQAEDGASDRLENAKMIYTARMEVETTAFDTAAADLRTLVEILGGYFEQAAVHNYGSGYRSGDYTVRVPADQFQPFLDRVGTLCHVTYQEQTSENVSEAYYDAESRLATQRTKLERLQNLLAQAENMEDIITIESAISDTELEIERLTGTLRQYDALVDYATVHLSLQEVYQLSNVEEPATSFASRMGAAFASGWRGFVGALESLAVALAYGWVWLLLLAAAGTAAGRILWKRRRRERQAASKEPENKP